MPAFFFISTDLTAQMYGVLLHVWATFARHTEIVISLLTSCVFVVIMSFMTFCSFITFKPYLFERMKLHNMLRICLDINFEFFRHSMVGMLIKRTFINFQLSELYWSSIYFVQ